MSLPSPPTVDSVRTDLIVTTALKPAPDLIERATVLGRDLNAPVVARRNDGLAVLFARAPDADRVLIVQRDRLVLGRRDGATFFYHPNMAYLRLGNLLRGGRDLLIEAAGLQPGESVLDATLGYASEAILCAHVVGETGIVHGIEASPELGIVVREGLQTVTTAHRVLNECMRRIQVVHIGHHLTFLRDCPSGSYDVVCFDPFFDAVLHDSIAFSPLRAFGEHHALLPEAVAEARRVARRRVVVKALCTDDTLDRLGAPERVGSRSGKVVYGVFPAH